MISRRCATGAIVKRGLPNGLPKGMDGFAFNTRRPMFADPRVREALAMMFDFEWINANLYGGALPPLEELLRRQRTVVGGPAGRGAERALLAPFPGAVRADMMEGRWAPPVSDGSGRDRALAQARAGAARRKPATRSTDGALRDARRRAARLRDHGQAVAQEERLALAYSQSPGAHRRRRRRCAWSTKCNSSAAAASSIST